MIRGSVLSPPLGCRHNCIWSRVRICKHTAVRTETPTQPLQDSIGRNSSKDLGPAPNHRRLSGQVRSHGFLRRHEYRRFRAQKSANRRSCSADINTSCRQRGGGQESALAMIWKKTNGAVDHLSPVRTRTMCRTRVGLSQQNFSHALWGGCPCEIRWIGT